MKTSSNCPSCGTEKMEIFHTLDSVPTNSCILLETPQKAIDYPKGRIQLGFCSDCGFISNVAFDQKLTEYSGRYEETQGFSATFRTFHEKLAARLIDCYDLRGKKVIEIGCGKGEFLILLCEMGGNSGIGVDPGYVEDRIDSPAMDRITFIQDFYSEKYASHQADFICCKMTLEHIHPTAEFVSIVRRSIKDHSDTIVFFQIPNATRILQDCAFEDIYYEHCSYFTPGSLERLFRRCGFEVLEVETEYDAQYLTIVARPAGNQDRKAEVRTSHQHDMDKVKDYVAGFPQMFKEKHLLWHHRLEKFRAENKKVVLWGSGSKAVSFLTMLDVSTEIKYVVDINPYRKGFYMAGTGQEIVDPDFLEEYQPAIVIIMNSIYQNEIEKTLAQKGIKAELLTL